MISQNDDRKRRCPRLGHEITFAYCREPGSALPCPKIYDCWWEKFDIKEFMNEHYSEDVLKQINEPQETKLNSILEIIKQAKERQKK